MFQTKRGRTKSPSGTTVTQHHLCAPFFFFFFFVTLQGRDPHKRAFLWQWFFHYSRGKHGRRSRVYTAGCSLCPGRGNRLRMGPRRCLTLRVGIYLIIVHGKFFSNRDQAETRKLLDQFTLIYETMFTKFTVKLPFTEFKCDVLWTLNIAPTQLHPNSWGFVKAFAILLRGLDSEPSIGCFFSFSFPSEWRVS